MAGFLYFRPGHQSAVTRELIVEWGLGHAFPGPIAPRMCTANTPTGSPGTVFADPERMGERGIAMDMPNQATWRKMPTLRVGDAGETYVSFWKEAKPTPADLIRRPYLPGYTVRLASDAEWIVPLVRRFDTAALKSVSDLPCYMECDEHGNWHRGPVIEIHAHLWDLTAPIADAMLANYVEGQAPVVTEDDVLKALVGLLSENYVVGAGELSLMRAFSNEGYTHAAVMAACDWPTFMEWHEQKKSESPSQPAGASSSAGEIA